MAMRHLAAQGPEKFVYFAFNLEIAVFVFIGCSNSHAVIFWCLSLLGRLSIYSQRAGLSARTYPIQ